MTQKATMKTLAQSNTIPRRRISGKLIPFLLLLAAAFVAPLAGADPLDLGGLFYELDSDMQEPANRQPAIAMPPPISFHCGASLVGLSCMDNHHLHYHCTDYGASGQYCRRQDGKVWIHCFPQFFHRHHCTVVSNTGGSRQ